MNARLIAARALLRIERDGAFAAAALDAELSRHPDLDPRERGLATELVYGAVRCRGALVTRLSRYASKLNDDVVLSHLLVAAYQVLVLERVPAFAAVNGAVEAIRKERGPKVGGFANAVLRKLVSSGEKLDRAQAARESVPAWLRQKLEGVVGPEEADALVGADGASPRLSLRVSLGRELPAWLAELEASASSERFRRLPVGFGDPRRMEGWKEGAFTIQEEGAQLVALALGAKPGERVLDACAGRGQKTSLLREQVGGGVELWATDLHQRKLEQLREEFERLKLEPPHTAAVDWSVGPGAVPDGFDRVLVDAPCTGTGTLRKRPEIAQRLTPEDPARLGELASKILLQAAARARSGGTVVFAVCSVLAEEGEAVLERVQSKLELVPFEAPELSSIAQGKPYLRLLPRAHGTDGYFLASFRVR